MAPGLKSKGLSPPSEIRFYSQPFRRGQSPRDPLVPAGEPPLIGANRILALIAISFPPARSVKGACSAWKRCETFRDFVTRIDDKAGRDRESFAGRGITSVPPTIYVLIRRDDPRVGDLALSVEMNNRRITGAIERAKRSFRWFQGDRIENSYKVSAMFLLICTTFELTASTHF